MPERSPESPTDTLVQQTVEGRARTALQGIADIPAEESWRAGLKSDQTRRA